MLAKPFRYIFRVKDHPYITLLLEGGGGILEKVNVYFQSYASVDYKGKRGRGKRNLKCANIIYGWSLSKLQKKQTQF